MNKKIKNLFYDIGYLCDFLLKASTGFMLAFAFNTSIIEFKKNPEIYTSLKQKGNNYYFLFGGASILYAFANHRKYLAKSKMRKLGLEPELSDIVQLKYEPTKQEKIALHLQKNRKLYGLATLFFPTPFEFRLINDIVSNPEEFIPAIPFGVLCYGLKYFTGVMTAQGTGMFLKKSGQIKKNISYIPALFNSKIKEKIAIKEYKEDYSIKKFLFNYSANPDFNFLKKLDYSEGLEYGDFSGLDKLLNQYYLVHREYKNNLKENKGNLLMAFYAPIFNNGRNLSDKIWKDIFSKDHEFFENIFLKITQAQFYTNLNEKENYQNAWMNIIKELCERNADYVFTNIGKSRHQVYEFNIKPLKSTVIVKECKKENNSLRKEFQRADYFRKYLGNQIMHPLANIDIDDSNYLVSVRMNNNLHNIFLNLEKLDSEKRNKLTHKYITESLDLLKKVQDLGDSLVLDIPFKGYYKDRVEKVFVDQLKKYLSIHINSEFIENHSIIDEYLFKTKKAYYKDNNLKNIVINDDQKISFIDFEGNRKVNCLLDVVNTLEFSRFYLGRSSIESYATEFANFEEYIFASYQRHLELAGYRARDAYHAIDNFDLQEQKKELKYFDYHIYSAKNRLNQILKIVDKKHKSLIDKNLEILYNITIS